MSINEVAGAIGEWSVKLSPDTPKHILDKLDYFGHVAVVSGRVNPTRYGDNLLATARYVGVLRGREFSLETKSVSGPGMAMWLGDEDDKGDVIETPMNFSSATFNVAISSILPAAALGGTIYGQAGTYTGVHQYESRRASIDYITSLFNCEWRVNYNGTVDAGLASQLYPSTPTCAVVARIPEGGIDMDRRVLPGLAGLEADMADFTTRTFLVSEPEDGAPVVTGFANIGAGLNPYKDIHGNTLKMTRLISGNNTIAANANSVAQLQLNRFTKPREAITLSTLTHDIKGDLVCGGYIWVEDVDAKLVDLENQVRFKGLTLNPVKLRVMELSYPIEDGNTVAYRGGDGVWTDITPHVIWESGETTVVVGGYSRSLTGVGGSLQPVGSMPLVNLTVPATPVFNVAAIESATYIHPTTGLSRAQIALEWTQPLNTNGDIITDGGRYEIRYRNTTSNTFTGVLPWNYVAVPWGVTRFLLQELDPGTQYEFQIRAIDNGSPANSSAWSASFVTTTQRDTTAPAAPAPGTIAAGKLTVQLTHTLGAATGGTYNLAADLHHLNLYEGPDSAFTITSANKIGQADCNVGHLISAKPVVRSFNVNVVTARWYKVTAVDNDGNESLSSTAVQATAQLLDSAFISDLVVSKVTAGTISTNWIQAAEMMTATSGSRMAFGFYGLEGFDGSNNKVFDFNTSDGSLFVTGTLQTGLVGRRIRVSGVNNMIEFFPQVGETRKATINSYIPVNFPNDIAIEIRSIDSDSTVDNARLIVLPDTVQMSVTPRTNEGAARTSVFSTVDKAYITANQITGPSVTFSRAYVSVDTNGEIYLIGTASNGVVINKTSHAFTRIRSEILEEATANGGFLELGKQGFLPSTFGHRVPSAGIDSYLKFSGQDFEVLTQSTVRLKVNSTVTTISGNVEADTYKGRGTIPAFMESEGGEDVRFVFGGSGLQFNGRSGALLKTFVIPHPSDAERLLIHATTESPQAGAHYWGTAVVVDGLATVDLPSYFEDLNGLEGRAVSLTVLAENDPESRGKLPGRKETPPEKVDLRRYIGHRPQGPPIGRCPVVQATYPENGQFQIIGSGGPDAFRVMWTVLAIRKDVPQFDVEPLKAQGTVRGDGPYTYFVEN